MRNNFEDDTLRISPTTTHLLDDLAKYTKLVNLYCDDCGLTALPALPPTLVTLTCCKNNLAQLPDLHEGLRVVYCAKNQLQWLPPLPSTLEQLHCRFNLLQDLPELPPALGYLTCTNNEFPDECCDTSFNQITVMRKYAASQCCVYELK